MFIKNLYLPLFLAAFAFFTVQCTTSSTPDDVPTTDVENLDLLGLDDSFTTTVVAKFTQGVPTTTLDQATYESMYQRVAQISQKLDGNLVNYYVEAKEGPEGLSYFLILNGELSDGTYMKTGFLLTGTEGGMTVDQARRGRPVPHWSCRGSICSNCIYQYDLTGNISCGCDLGPNDCVKYYPDQDPS